MLLTARHLLNNTDNNTHILPIQKMTTPQIQLTKDEQLAVTKLGQKLTEAMSRMHKNAMPFCFVNLEMTTYTITRHVGDKSFTLKRGPAIYSCTDRIIGLVSYYEDPDDAEKSYLTLYLNVPGKLLVEQHGGIGYQSVVDMTSIVFNNDDVQEDDTTLNLYGLGFYLMDTQEFGLISLGKDTNIPSQWHFTMKSYHPSPFKQVDDIMKRFYDHMRARGFLADDSEDEDMGVLADNAGIEW